MKWDPRTENWVEEYKELETKTRAPVRFWVFALSVVIIVIFAIAGSFLLPREAPANPKPKVDTLDLSPAPTPAPTIEYGFNQKTLKAVARDVAAAYYVEDNEALSTEKLALAQRLAIPCQLYMSSGYHKPGDFKKASVRAEYHRDARKAGVDHVLVKVGGRYAGLVQHCPEES